MTRREIAEEILGGGVSIDERGFAQCPGIALHSLKNGRRDFKIFGLDDDSAPTGKCVHKSCFSVVEEFNRILRQRIGREEAGGRPLFHSRRRGLPPAPAKAIPKAPELDRGALDRFLRSAPERCGEVRWWLERSAVAVPEPRDQAQAFLGSGLYGAGDVVLLMWSAWSSGDFAYSANDRRFYRLAQQPDVKAKRVGSLPCGGEGGVFFLANPVDGQWRPTEGGKLSRRVGDCVRAWRFLVIESDDVEQAAWLRVLAALPLPIAAVFSSGGRSIHALVRFDCASKPELDLRRDMLRQALCPLGADPAAMSAVRLSRLPGMTRGGRLQRLIFLDPWPDPAGVPVVDRGASIS